MVSVVEIFLNWCVRPFKGKGVCICLVKFSFGGGEEDLLGRIFIWTSGVVPRSIISIYPPYNLSI